jgi:hypothetical protein
MRLLFEALLGGAGAVVGARWARVGPEDEDRLRARQEEGVAVEGVTGFAGELERLDLGGDGEGEEAEQDPPQRREPDPFQHPLDVERGPRRARPTRLLLPAPA